MMSAPRIVVTGGAGFIGSHTAKLLRRSGMEPVVYDNLVTGNRTAVRWGPFVRGDVLDTPFLTRMLVRYKPEAVMHFAASAYVGESVENPEKYYRNNVAGALSLLSACRQAKIGKVIFSSSCATYGVPATLPITEAAPRRPVSPYGRTKHMAEQMLEDYAAAYGLRYATLRYFNACGADPEGEIGEWHNPETHLIPRALMAAGGRIAQLDVFGTDYETADGTCIRDYIHVMDLARAHVLAAEYLAKGGVSRAFNLGSGRGFSIFEVLDAIARVTARRVPIKFHPRRSGDPPALYADPTLARQTLGFSVECSDLDTIVRTAAPFFGVEAVS